ncbi:MAG: NAD(P)/FAD-dependent oxidoreductase [Acidobacteriota bacterium]|nr:NAD(P)/FAD-dependent oxidoreductase [Acidobacteriota bacterium]
MSGAAGTAPNEGISGAAGADDRELRGGSAWRERRGPYGAAHYDAVIVGASLAGCATAIGLGRAGARVALIEQRREAGAFKRVCSHYIQSSAVPALERLGLLEQMLAAGAVRSRIRMWTRWGWIEPARESAVPSGVNLRRELLDPMIREVAAGTEGVDLVLGLGAEELLYDTGRDGSGSVCGVRARARDGARLTFEAQLVVGADGRGSRTARLAGVPAKRVAHRRFAYGAYFAGPPPDGAPDSSFWLLDPHMAAAFPTDGGLTFYAVMPTMEMLPQFRADPEGSLRAFVASLPDAPPIERCGVVETGDEQRVQGKIDMTNVAHAPTAPGLALVGDAALAIDPLWGVGCGWALQSAEWLAESVGPALGGAERLERALRRYRRRHARRLRGHVAMIHGYTGGRPLSLGERFTFSAAAGDERVARVMEAYGSRNVGPARMLARAVPLAARAHVRGAAAALGWPGGGSAGGAPARGAAATRPPHFSPPLRATVRRPGAGGR